MRTVLCLLVLLGCSTVTTNQIGAGFVGAKYAYSPLGENSGIDSDPLIRFDAFDCTTFVETVLANGNLEHLNKIRYKDGKIDFLSRNHFIETDWLQNNKDIVENVSDKYASTAVRTVIIDKQSWLKKVHDIDAKFVPETVNLIYIPYQNAAAVKITESHIVLFVADNPKIHDKIGTGLAVVHMGFLLPNGILRHASSRLNRVADVDFMEYIATQMKDKNNIGFVLVKIK